MKRRILFLGLAFLFLLTASAVLFLRRQPSRTNEPLVPSLTPAARQLGTPVFPRGTNQPPPTYTIDSPIVDFPLSLPAFERQPDVQTAPFAARVAQNLGFAGQPAIRGAPPEKTYQWQRGGATLSIGGDPVSIVYTSGAVAVGASSLSLPQLRSAAASFIQKIGLSSSVVSFADMEPNYFAAPLGNIPQELPGPAQAVLIQVNYRYTINNRPLFLGIPNVPGASVRFNARGDVVLFRAMWVPEVISQKTEIPVISAQKAIERLMAGVGVLVSVSPQQTKDPEGIQYTVNASSVREILLGYYYGPGQTIFAPVYLFSGEGTDPDTGTPVSTVTIISAVQ